MQPRRAGPFALVAAVLSISACGAVPDEDAATVDANQEALGAHCSVHINGVGTRDVEADYLPHVVHCENGGAPFEALKAQAIAARTYLYYKLATSGSIDDGQGDQVYSCGSDPTDLQRQAVQETALQILRHEGSTLCSFYVAGDSTLSAPDCEGNDADAGTEKYVTYNLGKTGSAVDPSPLGSTSNPVNRGCMSQWGSRCLASSGRGYVDILGFYYGADVEIVTMDGSCAGDGGGLGENGCTAQKTSDCAAYGCACADGACSGGACDGNGCTAQKTSDCGAFGCGCVDGECSGGACDGSGCTWKAQQNCGAFGCGCVDGECSGGACDGSGCTWKAQQNCGAFGCGCQDMQCSGGACEGTGCSWKLEQDCAAYACGCSLMECSGGACSP